MKKALVIGYSGQDGSYATELLRAKGYRVLGVARDPAKPCPVTPDERVAWNMRDANVIAKIIADHRPDEIYNFSGYSSGSGMFDDPLGIGQVNGLAITMLLEAIRLTGENMRFCQASSSEMFGNALETPQTESTPFNPRSPYGAAKIYAHNMIGIYRKTYGLFACSAILYNHESPRRGTGFVTRKVVREAVQIKRGLATKLYLGDLEARRDWGFAGDYVHAMWLALQQDLPDDYIIATGESRSVRELCERVFSYLGLNYEDHVSEDKGARRERENIPLVGVSRKAQVELGWKPTVSFDALIKIMVDAEIALLQMLDNS